jgi:hypothetical protein
MSVRKYCSVRTHGKKNPGASPVIWIAIDA